MKWDEVFDRTGSITAVAVFIVSIILFFTDTGAFWGSLAAAILSAAWAWGTYVIIKWIIEAIKS